MGRNHGPGPSRKVTGCQEVSHINPGKMSTPCDLGVVTRPPRFSSFPRGPVQADWGCIPDPRRGKVKGGPNWSRRGPTRKGSRFRPSCSGLTNKSDPTPRPDRSAFVGVLQTGSPSPRGWPSFLLPPFRPPRPPGSVERVGPRVEVGTEGVGVSDPTCVIRESPTPSSTPREERK